MRSLPGISLFGLLLAAPAITAGSDSKPAAASGCVECHLALDDARLTPPARAFADDVHARAGFTCIFCHGGNPAQEDQELAHDRKKGFLGRPKPRDIPPICGKCHSDPTAMKQFNPALRVDQLAEYRTSGHGKKLLEGDTQVAHCASCHGAHGVLPVKDSRSPVSPTRIAQTCNRCHGDAALMANYGLPSDAYGKYTRSVHYRVRVEKGDLSAPTCNSCHGNHGAAAPQVGSVANVCGTCHTVFAEQFKASPHWEVFQELGLPTCVTCHESHEILRPSEAFLAEGPQSKCASCHEPGSAGGKAAAAMRADLLRLARETERARKVLRQAAEAGMEVSRFQFELVKADNALTKARADVHLFQVFAVHQGATEGLGVARSVQAAGERALQERDFRRKWLFVSLAFILLAVIGLLLKIRDLNRHRESSPGL